MQVWCNGSTTVSKTVCSGSNPLTCAILEEYMNKYKKLRVSDRLIDEHRLIMEKCLGRKLLRNEIVHHKDGDKSNNKLENLEIMSRAEHSRKHQKGKKMSSETKQKISKAKIGKAHKDSRKVIQIDMSSNEEVRIFNSTIEASRIIDKANGDAHIRDCCKGIRRTAYGYKWKWANL